MKIRLTTTMMMMVLLMVVSCAPADSGNEGGSTPSTEGTSVPDGVILAESPGTVESLATVKGQAKTGDQVKFSARIGGRKKPFVDGRAVMVVIDPSLPSCADNEGDTCPVPWDYCCETPQDVAENTATVQLVDDAGKPLALSLEGQGNLEALDWITVVGTVEEKGEGGLFVVNATGLYLDKKGS